MYREDEEDARRSIERRLDPFQVELPAFSNGDLTNPLGFLAVRNAGRGGRAETPERSTKTIMLITGRRRRTHSWLFALLIARHVSGLSSPPRFPRFFTHSLTLPLVPDPTDVNDTRIPLNALHYPPKLSSDPANSVIIFRNVCILRSNR